MKIEAGNEGPKVFQMGFRGSGFRISPRALSGFRELQELLNPRPETLNPTVGASIIRIGLWGF